MVTMKVLWKRSLPSRLRTPRADHAALRIVRHDLEHGIEVLPFRDARSDERMLDQRAFARVERTVRIVGVAGRRAAAVSLQLAIHAVSWSQDPPEF
jgi:hypothetical protein